MNKDNAKDFLPLVQALADGKEIQVQLQGEWLDVHCPSFGTPPEFYRIKPEPRKPREFLVSLTESGAVYDCAEAPEMPERMGKCTIVRTIEIIEE